MSKKRIGSFVSTQMVLHTVLSLKVTINNVSGRIPVIIDNTVSPPHPVMETSAELLYLLKFADKDDKFGFTDAQEQSDLLQWLFFWHGSGAPYQGNLGFFRRAAEQVPCRIYPPIPAFFYLPVI
jgi:glutathione S-transferase